jgi:RimJ/RimL family protein N-acetyltransferase
MEHFDDLLSVGLDESIWELNPRSIETPDDLRDYIKSALKEARSGISIPFAIVLRGSGKAVGSTRFGNIDVPNRRLEIGWTWLGRNWWRTGANTECKILLLTHGFEDLGCARVELKTDVLNVRSRNAILRIGAREEGVLRKHILTQGGRWRDTVYYSILDHEWPVVKKRLESMKAKYE